MITQTLRETGENENRPQPYGNFDGYTRAQMVADLIALSDAPPVAPRRFSLWRLLALFTCLFLCANLTTAQTVTCGGTTCAKLTPAQAADVMRGTAMQSNMANRPAPLPPVGASIVVHSTPGALGWLPFPPTSEPRRLDGTLLTQPAQVYGPQNVVIVQQETPTLK